MSRRLYLDLDGVMADFDGTFPAVFGLDHRVMADDAMWLKINGHPSFFRDLPPMAGAVEFFRTIEHLDPIILTACPKSNYAHVATQKVEWVRAHLSAHVTVLPVLGGSSKPLFMHAKGDILIDDFRRNTEAWAAAGGHAILHRGFEGTAAALEAAIGSYVANTVHGGADVQDSVPAADSATLTALIAMFRQREQVGLAKYGTTVDRTDLSLRDWLQHALEESMDKSLYLLRAIETAGVPAGWKLVPVDPDWTMILAGNSSDGSALDTYRKMMAAAPEVPRG